MGRMYVLEVWMRLRVFMSVWALYGEANAPYWKTIKRPNSSHLTLLDTKTALYKLPKNRWVIVHFEIFGPVRNKLLVTVSLDHPVAEQCQSKTCTAKQLRNRKVDEHVVQVQEPGCECCTKSRHRRLDCLDHQMSRWKRGALADEETSFCTH